MNEAIRVNEYEFSARNIEPEISIVGEAKLDGDEPLLFRAFANILSNAAKYAPEGARAWAKLTIEETDGRQTAHILIGNDGVTLKQEECDGLFERYRRGRTSRGTGGTGLGLHVVRIVTDAHGGTVRCITRPDFGEIEFEVTLPLGKA